MPVAITRRMPDSGSSATSLQRPQSLCEHASRFWVVRTRFAFQFTPQAGISQMPITYRSIATRWPIESRSRAGPRLFDGCSMAF